MTENGFRVRDGSSMVIEQWRVDDVRPYDRNPRNNDDAVDKVAASIREFGWRQPLVVDGDGVLIVGHTRLMAAKKLGLDYVPVTVARDLTPEQASAYRLADNRTHEEAKWVQDMLGAELRALQDSGFDISVTGFDDNEIARALAASGDDGDNESPLPDPPSNPVTRVGDVWSLGRHRVVCGDAGDRGVVDAVMDGAQAAAVFTSPPYGVDLEYDHYVDTFDALKTTLDRVIPEIDRAMAAGAFCTINFADIVKGRGILGTDEVCEYPMALEYWPRCRAVGWLLHTRRVWAKTPAMVSAPWTANSSRAACDWEHLWTWKKPGPDRSFRTNESAAGVWSWDMAKLEHGIMDHHPAAFPSYIVKMGLEFYSRQGDVVYEPFAGSGTTLVVCENIGRSCRAVELSPAYCDVIVDRWQSITGEKASRG